MMSVINLFLKDDMASWPANKITKAGLLTTGFLFTLSPNSQASHPRCNLHFSFACASAAGKGEPRPIA